MTGLTAPRWARFLQASIERSLDSAGRADLLVGLVAGGIGFLLKVDLAPLALLVVFVVFLVRVLIVSPAAMWAEGGGTHVQSARIELKVEAGGTVNIIQNGPTVSLAPLAGTDPTDTAAASGRQAPP